jgi:hypothetical protein
MQNCEISFDFVFLLFSPKNKRRISKKDSALIGTISINLTSFLANDGRAEFKIVGFRGWGYRLMPQFLTTFGAA